MSISIKPYYRTDRGSVVIKVYVDRKTAKVINLGIKITEEQWNEADRKIVKHPNAKLLNQKIKNKVLELEREITRAELLGVTLTEGKVKQIAEGRKVTTNFYEWAEPWIDEKYRNRDTRDAMLSDLNKLKAFAPKLQFGDIDAGFLTRYHNYMIYDLGNKGNTPWKGLKFIRTMLYDAAGLAPQNPFKDRSFKMPRYQETHKDGLYISECDQIEKLFDQEVPVLVKIVAAKFLFMCYSGLRISDAKKFSVAEHIQNDERLIIDTQKEGVRVNLKLHSRLIRALERIRSLPEKSLSDQKMNEWLKLVGAAANIDRIVLTNHVGRHTWGCILAEMNIPVDIAQKLLGHKKRESTLLYYKLRQKKLDEYAGVLNKM